MEVIIRDKEKYIRYALKSFPKLNWEQVDDIFSEAVFRIYKRKNPISIAPGYVYTVMRNIIFDQGRKKSLQIIDEEILTNIPDQLVYPRITYHDIRPIIYGMKDSYKRYLILRFGFQMKQTEIAEFLGISRGTVAPMIMRATQKLKQFKS